MHTVLKHGLLTAMIAAIIGIPALCHAGEVTMGPEINVGHFLATAPLNQYQSDLRCHPTDPDRMVVTAKNGIEEHTVGFTTIDGGASWTATRQNASGDPDCFYGNNGWAHWFYMDKTLRRIGYRRSKQADGVWESGRLISTTYYDHPHAVVDRSPASPYVGSIYHAGRLASGSRMEVIRSRDDGDTWASTVFDTGPDFAEGFVDGPPLVMADGTLILFGRSQNRIISDGGGYAGSRRDIFVFRSTDGGISFSPPILVCDHNGVKRSRGGSRSISGGLVHVNGIERLIIVLSRDRSDLPSVLQVVSSDDGGLTWTAPRDILPPYPNGTWSAGGMISVMVNADDVIGLQYFNLSGSAGIFNVMFTWSTDGGGTWSAPSQVNAVANVEPNSSTQGREPGGDQVYGDVAADGTFRLVWPDHRTGDNVYRLYMRSLTVVPGGTYAVTYEANGATSGSVPASQAKTHDAPLTLRTNSGDLVRTGYTFGGWNTAADGMGTDYAAGGSYTANAAVTLHARWVPATYAVVYHANGATGGTVPASQVKTHDVALTLRANAGGLVRTGYAFSGWNTAANGTGSSYAVGGNYTANAAVALHALWISGNLAPVVHAATIASDPVTGISAALGAVATDDGGEAALTYTWTIVTGPVGAPAPSFSVNGTHGAKDVVATFARAGAYTLRVTARDAEGLSSSRDLALSVAQTATGTSVMPVSVTVEPGAQAIFSAELRDQFGQIMPAATSWSVSGGGTMSAAGVFTAGMTSGGPYTVTATAAGRSGLALVTIGGAPTGSVAATGSTAGSASCGLGALAGLVGVGVALFLGLLRRTRTA